VGSRWGFSGDFPSFFPPNGLSYPLHPPTSCPSGVSRPRRSQLEILLKERCRVASSYNIRKALSNPPLQLLTSLDPFPSPPLPVPATMTYEFNTAGGDGLLDLTFNQRDRHPYATSANSSPPAPTTVMPAASRPHTWTLPIDLASGTGASPGAMSNLSNSPEEQHSQLAQLPQQAPSPVHNHHSAASSPLSQHTHHAPFQQGSAPTLTEWVLQQRQQQQQFMAAQFPFLQPDPTLMFPPFGSNFQPTPLEYLPPTTTAALQAGLLEPSFAPIPAVEDAALQWQGMSMGDLGAAIPLEGLSSSIGSSSPTGRWEEVSIPSSNEPWTVVPEFQQNFEFGAPPGHSVFNPSQTLHLRTNSDSSDGAGSIQLVGSYEEVQFPSYQSPFSPADSDPCADSSHRDCFPGHHHSPTEMAKPEANASVGPIAIKRSPSSRPSPSSGSGAGSTSPPSTARRNSGPRKSPVAKTTTKVIRRKSGTEKKDGTGEKKVGRRRGPLLPEQRKQASEIRKLRACLRCKFLKKTCDKGEPCAGCQPSHARLWQVPCTRIDIKDIGYFMKDWKADYERHLSLAVSVYNVKGFSPKESLMWITHGYGFALPVSVREVYVADESCFNLDWVESHLTDQEPIDFDIRTEKLDVGAEGISVEALSEYLDKHIDGPFEDFIDDHFEGTPFITEILKTAHRFYVKEKMPVIRKALKLVLAYNLTFHITMVENQGSEMNLEGQIDDEDSKFYGKVVAPVMVNFQIKCAMAEMWRELQKDILEELSALYSSVYSGERLKNWPTIFMLASILLAVWEEMQFDCHYRVPDPVAVNKFCSDMETTPVGVIVGLFHAISQKLPPFTDWDTRKHGHLLNNNVAVCEAMTEVREHVMKHGKFAWIVKAFKHGC
jgi:hypothetical protein